MAYSENDTILSGNTMSDSVTTSNTIAYTPLSEYSYSTSSNYEASYQPLSSSISSSHLPKSSTESIRNCESKTYENVSRNRLSYPGEHRTSIPIRNRFSLQTLNSLPLSDCNSDYIKSHSTSEKKQSDDPSLQKTHIGSSEVLPKEEVFNKCDVYEENISTKLECDNKHNNEKNLNCLNSSILSNEESCWNHNNYENCNFSYSPSSDSTASEQNSGYEKVQKLELILNDKDMFSESQKLVDSPASESPYELVAVVDNRMTSVSTGDNKAFLENKRDLSPLDSAYEEVRPISPNLRRPLNTLVTTIYASRYEICNFENGSEMECEKKPNYEEISLLDDISDLRALSSSSESLESSMDEAMIENNFYESLLAEDSSPDTGSNQSSKIADNETTYKSDRNEVM